MKVAIVYDRVNKWGGAERVLLALHELFPQAPLYTAVYNPETAPWAKVFPNVIPSFLQKIPFTKTKHEFLGTFTPLAFENLDFSDYDLVISVTSEAAKGIITKPGTVHVCYCLTPTRYLWSHYKTYFKGSTFKAITKPVVLYLRAWDKIAAQRPDVVVSISTAVKKRIKKYYGRDSKVIYPPVNVDFFSKLDVDKSLLLCSNRPRSKWRDNEFYLIVSRFVPYKRVDLAIEAFNEVGLPLVIGGSGREEARLKSQAKKNIKFVGELTDSQLAGYYQKARALIFPQEEDFGIVAVEAQASGIPVIAYRAGGALDTVIDGKTGIFFDEENKESLIKAISKFKRLSFDKKELVKNAEKFSKERFKKDFRKLIKNVKR